MKKSDLKNGMVVELRDGERGIIINNKFLSKETFLKLTDINDDLEEINGETNCDIIKIFETTETFVLNDMSTGEDMILMWERKQDIDWTKVPKGTEIKVKDFDKGIWKKRIFIGYLGGKYRNPFVFQSSLDEQCAFLSEYATIDNPKLEWLK